MRIKTNTGLLACALVVTACGGGGSDAGDNTVYDAKAAFANLQSNTFTRNMTGTVQGQSVNVSFGFMPGTGTSFPFNGTPAREQRNVATINGSTTVTASVYVDANGTIVGTVTDPDSNTPTCGVSTSTSAVPAAVKVGLSGPIAAGNYYDSCSPDAKITGTFTETWAVRVRNGQTYFCDQTVSQEGSDVTTASQCFAINAAGALLAPAWVDITYVINGQANTVSFATP
jgi:hypothetical protein